MHASIRRSLPAALIAGLAFGLVACNKNKDVETDPAAEMEAAPASTARATVGGDPEVESAAFHPSRAKEVIEENMDSVTACFEGQGAKKVNVALTVSTDGSVSSAKSNAGAPNVDSCLSAAFKTMTFPAPRGGEAISVKIPISYVP